MRDIKHNITPEHEAWLVQHYADTSNAECLSRLGMPPNAWRSLSRIAARLGLEKSKQYMRDAQRRAANCAAKVNKLCGNSGAANLIKYGKKHQFKKGHDPRCGLDEERWRDVCARRGKSLSETWSKERRRVLFGLEQLTNLRAIKQDTRVYNLRHRMRMAGYKIKRGSSVVIITADTRRSKAMERQCEKLHFKLTEQI